MQNNYIYTVIENESGVLGHNAALKGYIGPGTAWANEMNFWINYAPGAGLIAQPVDL